MNPPYRGQIMFLFFDQEFHDSLHEKYVEFLIQLQKKYGFPGACSCSTYRGQQDFRPGNYGIPSAFFIKLSENPRILEVCL